METTEPSADGLRVEVVGPADREDQARLFSRCFAKPTGVEALRWRYDTNPHGQAVSLVLRGDDDRSVCSYAYVPRLAVAGSAEGPIGQQGDVMTDPDWQRKGLARRLVQHCADETRRAGFLINWGFPNRQSAPVFLKFDWKNAGKIRPRRCILRADGAAKARRLGDGRLAVLKLGLDRRRSSRARRALGLLPPGLEVRAIERFAPFGDRIEQLSREVEQRFAFMLRREATWLDWRFVDTPTGAHRSFGLFDAGGELLGYFVLQVPPGPAAPGLSCAKGVGYLVELLCPDEDLVRPLMAAALAELERAGASIAEAWSVDGSWWQQHLVAAGFLDAKPENHLYVYFYALVDGHGVVDAAADASTWYLTDGDRDDETMG